MTARIPPLEEWAELGLGLDAVRPPHLDYRPPLPRSGLILPSERILLPVPGLDLSLFRMPMMVESAAADIAGLRVYHLRCISEVKDRDHPDRLIHVLFNQEVDGRMLASVGVSRVLYELVRAAMIHELDESWLEWGRRVRDPHAPSSLPFRIDIP